MTRVAATSLVTVTGQYLDVNKDPYRGTVAFTPTAWVEDPGTGEFFPQVPVTVDLDAQGRFTIQLISTASQDLEPQGWVYQVVETIEGRQRTWYAAIDRSGPLTDFTPVVPPEEWESTRGPRGFSVLSGPRPPEPSDGSNGDSWVDTVAHRFYAPKENGAWGDSWFIGGEGAPGPPGPKGDPGAVEVYGPQPEPPTPQSKGALWIYNGA